MKLTPRIQSAIFLAAQLHKNHTRKDKQKTPYITHLFSVMLLLSEVTDDEDILIAGLMHDALEDVPDYTLAKLTEDCGERVAHIVQNVTEALNANVGDDMQLPWLARKEGYLRILKEADEESILVSCADKIHNITSLILNYEEEGEQFLSRFHSSMRNIFWFYEEVFAIAEAKLQKDNVLLLNYRSILDRANVVFEKQLI